MLKTNAQISVGRRRKLLAILALGSALVLIFAVSMTWIWQTKDTPYRHRYSKLTAVKLPNQSDGTGANFLKPNEFGQVADLPAAKNSIEFVHNQTRNSKDVTLAYEASAATTVKDTISSTYLKNLNKALADPKDVSHSFDKQPVKDFLVARINKRYTVSLGAVRPLRTANIHSDAWVIDFTAKDASVKDTKKPNKLVGKAILAVKDKTYYYFMIASVDYNWQPNQKIWQQITDSLKIGQ